MAVIPVDKAVRRLKSRFKVLSMSADSSEARVKCPDCKNTFDWVVSRSVSGNSKCPVCATSGLGKYKRTQEQFELHVKIHKPEFTVVSEFIGAHEPATFRHTCGAEWTLPSASMFRKSSCPECGRKRRTTETYRRELKPRNIALLGEYKGMRVLHKHKCLKCKHVWNVLPMNVIDRNSGCPRCVYDITNSGRYARTRIKVNGTEYQFQGYEIAALRVLKKQGFKLRDFRFSAAEGKPSIKYTQDKKQHLYIPDFYHEPSNTVVEVKSIFTLIGSFDSVDLFAKNKAKAKATRKAGYNFMLMLIDDSGKRVDISNWEKLTARQIRKVYDSR